MLRFHDRPRRYTRNTLMTSLVVAAVVELLTGCAGGGSGPTGVGAAGEGIDGPARTQRVAECASPRSEWVWCDDFEEDRLGRYFEYVNPDGRFARVAGVGIGASRGMRARFGRGMVEVGNLKVAFGRTPSGTFRAVDRGTANYRDVYWRVWVRNQPGWRSGPDIKMSRATVFAGSNWTQAAIGHVWSGGADGNFLIIDPASGTDAGGSLRTTRYNDFGNLRWLGYASGQTPILKTSSAGAWRCVEAHMRLNDPGQANGVLELWIDGRLDARRSGLNWVGSYSAYGINAIMLENYWNDGSPVDQERYFDNLVVSTRRIGC
jgi:hypothetical protein